MRNESLLQVTPSLGAALRALKLAEEERKKRELDRCPDLQSYFSSLGIT